MQNLPGKKIYQQVIVAVIDSGGINHEDFKKGRIWTNQRDCREWKK
jgi:hypothetical protein